MSALHAALWLRPEDPIRVDARWLPPLKTIGASIVGTIEVAGLTIQSEDPDALDDLAAALTEAATRMRIVARTEPVAS